MLHSMNSDFAKEVAILLASIEKENKDNQQVIEENEDKKTSKDSVFRSIVDTNY